MENIENNKRIVKNTIFLYFRMLIIMAVNLYTSRIILDVLGVEDFGIYSIVGGIVVFLSFINSSMAAATQRFLSFSMGQKNEEDLNITFNSTIIVHIIIAIVIFLLAEILGVWYINNYLVINSLRLNAALFVFHFSLLTMIVKIITVPYNAAIISNEKMSVYAYISIIDALMQLTAVFLLQYIIIDKLKLYAILVFGINFIVQMSYRIYSKIHFNECKFRRNWSILKIKEIFSYSGWNLFGTLSSVALDQGVNILLNKFFGVIVNAARTIAFQLGGAVGALTGNFQLAMNPQIVKSYSVNDRKSMINLINNGARYSFFLLFIIAMPVLYNTQSILELWLKNVPEYTVFFCQLVLINSLIAVLSGTLLTGAMATGKIKIYQIVVGSINLLNLPLSYILLKLGNNPYSTAYVMIFLSTIAFFARLIMLKRMIGLSIKVFAKNVLFKISTVAFISFVITYFFRLSGSSHIHLFINIVIAVLIVAFSIVSMGINSDERAFVKNYIKKKLRN